MADSVERPADDSPSTPMPGWPDKHMLEAAMGLLASAVAFDPATGWEDAKRRWFEAYHRHLASTREQHRMLYYLLWSNQRQMWWQPDGRGYTEDIAKAGAYTKEQAVAAVTQSALCQDRNRVTLMVAAPPDWVPPADQHVFGPGPLVDVLAAWLDSREPPAGDAPPAT